MTNKILYVPCIDLLINNMDFSINIKGIREAKNLSQKDDGSAIGLGAVQYSYIENGKTDLSVSPLMKITKTLMEQVSLTDSLTKREAKDSFHCFLCPCYKAQVQKHLEKRASGL